MNISIIAFLLLIGAIAFMISTISAGGGALLLLPLLSFYLSPAQAAPVIGLGNLIGRPVRLLLFWKYINWTVSKYYIPSACLGTIPGAWLFANLQTTWLQMLIGIFLMSTIFLYGFGNTSQSFQMKAWWFAPVGFISSFIITVIGAGGPILNPFYMNYGMDKEELIATKTANSFFVGVTQVGSYAFFSSLYGHLWMYGIVLGIGISVGNYLGKRLLKKMSSKSFRWWVIWMMFLSGLVLVLEPFF